MRLERSLEQWAGGKSAVIAEGSKAQMMYFIEDAQKDIAALAREVAAKDAEIERLRKALSEVVGYDRNFYDNGRPGYEAIARDALKGGDA